MRFALARLGAPSLVTVTLDLVPFLVPSGFPLGELAAVVDRPARSLVFGRPYAGADGARTSYREARSLLDYHQRPPVCFFDDVLVPRVLTGDVRARDVFLDELFGDLRAQRNGEPLVEALVGRRASRVSIPGVRPDAGRAFEHVALPARSRHRRHRHGRSRSRDPVSPAVRDAAARHRDSRSHGPAVKAMPEKRAVPARRMEEVLRGPIKSKTVFPVLLLNLISQRADHGYGLMQRIDDICGDLLAVNTNKIYPLLRRLEERGFVTATWDHPAKRSRRIYSITPEGIERLARIKEAMLPYLDSVERAAGRRESPCTNDAPVARPSARSALRVCGQVIAHAGERSFVVDRAGDAAGFDEDDLPYEMVCEILCEDGHARQFLVPNELSAEDVLSTSGGVPIGRDAFCCRQNSSRARTFSEKFQPTPRLRPQGPRSRSEKPLEFFFSGGRLAFSTVHVLASRGAVACRRTGVGGAGEADSTRDARRGDASQLVLGGRTLSYTARAGTITLRTNGRRRHAFSTPPSRSTASIRRTAR